MKLRKKVTHLITTATLTAASFLISAPVQATCTDEPYIGSVCITAASYCPRGFVEADGKLLSISSNTTLFAVIGTNYGGDGRTTFGVPDLRGRTPVGQGQGPGLGPVYLGSMRGMESFTPPSATLSGANEGEPVAKAQPQSNIPPQLGMRYCLAVDGLFPPRN